VTASFVAPGFGAQVEGGYWFGSDTTAAIPYAGVHAFSFRMPSYSETDVTGGGFGLAFARHVENEFRSELGMLFEHVMEFEKIDAKLEVYSRFAWVHDWFTDPTLLAFFETLPGPGFDVSGATPARDLARFGAGAELKLKERVIIEAEGNTEVAGRSHSYSGFGTMKVRW
jgi:outer membrane autotransporter protein